MSYFDEELNNAWAWFAVNWESWANLNTSLTEELKNIFNNTSGPSGPHKEPHWQWVRDNRKQLLELYNSLKNN